MNFIKRILGKKRRSEWDEMGLEYIDLRPEFEKKIERDAIAGLPLGPEIDSLVKELLDIGHTDHYLGDPGGKFADNMDHIRAREIGSILAEKGGRKLMIEVYYRIRVAENCNELHRGASRELEHVWNGIGNWRS